MTLRVLILHVVDFIFQSEEWPFAWFCEEMFRNLFNPSWEVSPETVTYLSLVCLFVCISVYFFSVCLFVYIPLSVCLLLASLYSHDLVLDCAAFLLSDIKLCRVNTVLHCGSCSSLRFVMGQPQL